MEQLAARFPGDQSKVIEVGKRGVLYRIIFSPTDPDWVSLIIRYSLGIGALIIPGFPLDISF